MKSWGVVLAIAASLGSGSSWADGVLNSSFQGADTSDGLQTRSLRLERGPAPVDLLWPYADEPESVEGWLANFDWNRREIFGDRREALRLRGGFLKKTRPGRLYYLTAGIDMVDSEPRGRVQPIAWEGHYGEEVLPEKLWVTAKGLRTLLGPESGLWDIQDAGRLASGIKTYFVYRPFEKLRFLHRGAYFSLDDGNNRHQTSLDALWGLSVGTPWIWVGLGAEALGLSQKGGGYWSPSSFWSAGPRFEVAAPLAGEKTRASAGLAINRFREESRDPGMGYYSLIALEHGTRGQTLGRLSYERIESSQSGRLWKQDRLMLDLALNLE